MLVSLPPNGATSIFIVVDPVLENCNAVGQSKTAKLPAPIVFASGLPAEVVLNEAVEILELEDEKVFPVTVKVANIEVDVKLKASIPSLFT